MTGKFASIAGIAALVALVGCRDGVEPTAPYAPRNVSGDVAYVGRAACESCHLGHATTYAHTGMGRSFSAMAPETAVADFDSENELVVPPGLHYRMERRGDEYWQRQFLLDGGGREFAVEEHRLVYWVGSSNHNRAYLIERDGRLFQAPVCWYPQGDRWALCPGYEHKNDHFARETSETCMFCHNGRMVLEAGARNDFVEPFPSGIDCERCHGPGALHVERWKRAGAVPDANGDDTIVHPRRLATAERRDVCFQCHLGDAAASERVLAHDRPLGAFRPGARLDDVVVAFRYAEPTIAEFGLSAQADRMIRSRCFTESEGRLECLSCHDPHVSVYADERPEDYFTQKCLGCHELDACSAPPEMLEASAHGGDCVACHMRTAEPDDQRFTTFTDHWIRRTIEVDPGEHGQRSFELEPVDPAAFAALPAAEQAFYRGRAALLKSDEAPLRARESLVAEAVARFDEAVAGGFDTADAWFFLGKARLAGRELRSAADAFGRAVAADPAHHDAAFALGQAVGALGDVPRAAQIFDAMLERDPDDPMALAELGRALAALGRPDEALAAYRRAVELEPWVAAVRLNLAKLLARTGRFEAAAEHGEVATTLDPDGVAGWEFLLRVGRQLGRRSTVDRARDVLARLGSDVATSRQSSSSDRP